jgi:acetyl esterase/lipase
MKKESVINRLNNIIDKKPPIKGKVHLDIEYAKVKRKQYALDIYEPLNKFDFGKAPVIVFMHGGSWTHGDKSTIRVIDRFVNELRDNGWFVISINYVAGLWGGFIDGALSNSIKALDWIVKNASIYGYDPKKTALHGVSAGGHIALLIALNERIEGIKFSFVLSEYAPTDFFDMANGDAFDDSKNFKLLSKRKQKELSPINYISKDIPPILLLHGTNDNRVHIRQSEKFFNKSMEISAPVDFFKIDGGNHGLLNIDEKERKKQEKTVLNFIKNHSK